MGESRISTLALCTGHHGELETWMHRFLVSDPAWELKGDRLVLSSGQSVIEFRERSS